MPEWKETPTKPPPEHKPGCNNLDEHPDSQIAVCYCQAWDEDEIAKQLEAYPNYLETRAKMTPKEHKPGCYNANRLPKGRIAECYCQSWSPKKSKQETETYPDYLERRLQNTPMSSEIASEVDAVAGITVTTNPQQRYEALKEHSAALRENTKALWAHTAAMKTLAQALHHMPQTMKLRY